MPREACGPALNCLGVDSPVENLSAEGPDIAKCFRYAFTEDSSFTCEFDLSLCNAFAAAGSDVGLLCSPPPSIIDGVNPPLPVIFSSSEQSCTVECAGGGSETYTVVAGTFVALSQAIADSQAHAFACTLAQLLCLGPLPALYTNTPQSCTALCPDGSTLTFEAPADLFTALSQAEANANAFEFACTLAALLCSGLPPLGLQEGAGEQRPPGAGPLWANSAQSCSSSCPGGGTFTYVVPGGTFLRESRAAANAVAHSLACQQAAIRRVCLSSLPGNACLQDFFAEFLSATGLTAPVVFAVVGGSLPPGIVLSGALLSGVPTLAGSYSFSIRATGSDGTYAQRSYTLAVTEITPSTLPSGSTSTPYAVALSVGGMTNPTWATIGALPPGLILNPATGVISGTPTLDGTYPFGIFVTDGVSTCQKSYSIMIEGGCLDLANLLWAAPIVFGQDGFNGWTFTPLPGATGATFVQTTFDSHIGGPDNFNVLGLGQVPFDSETDCHYNFHLDISTLLNSTVRITITRDDIGGPAHFLVDTTVLSAEIVADYPFTAPAGTYNIVVNCQIVQHEQGSTVVQGVFTSV
jgi:hypothetical protein